MWHSPVLGVDDCVVVSIKGASAGQLYARFNQSLSAVEANAVGPILKILQGYLKSATSGYGAGP